MICKCICNCSNLAGGQTGMPELCITCALMSELGRSDIHGLPYVPPVYKPMEPLAPITNEQKDIALQNFVAENGF